jgi:prepilin-type N-terminal cleavage/methylation domain-containing protein
MWAKQTVKNQTGFTIVELLIVIVVIGILAAITVVAYNGVQQRSNNTAIITNARNTINLIKSYKATYGSYPSLGGYCVTTDNSCVNYNSAVVTSNNASWMTELRKMGTPVGSVPVTSSTRYGIYFDGYAPRTYNHEAIAGLIMYWLNGNNQSCQLGDVVASDPAPLPGEQNAFITSSNAWTSTGGGITSCWVSV